MESMFRPLKKQWKLFLSSPPGRRFHDFHERRKAQKDRGHAGKGLLIGGIVITLLGLVLLPLPGPGSVVLAGGLMLVAAESTAMARVLDWMDKKRARLMEKVQRLCKRLGTQRCVLLGAGISVVVLGGGVGLWFWLT